MQNSSTRFDSPVILIAAPLVESVILTSLITILSPLHEITDPLEPVKVISSNVTLLPVILKIPDVPLALIDYYH